VKTGIQNDATAFSISAQGLGEDTMHLALNRRDSTLAHLFLASLETGPT
jgi:hypothetical protein